MRGAYVLHEYAVSHWLEHVVTGLSDCKKSLSLEKISGDIQAMIELRRKYDFERTNTGYVAHPSLKMFEAKTPEVFKALVPIHSFLQKRWTECSLADGKIFTSLPIMLVLMQKWHRGLLDRSRPFDTFCNAATSPSTLRSSALFNDQT